MTGPAKVTPPALLDGRTGELIQPAEGRPGMNLASRIVGIVAELGVVAKTGTHGELGYAYLTEADLLDACRPLELKFGILIVPSAIERTQVPHHETKAGTPILTTTLRLRMLVVNVDDTSDRLELDWLGESQDHGGHGTAQALTVALRTFRAKFYAVSTEEDAESERNRGARGRRTQREGPPPDGAWREREASPKQVEFARKLLRSRHLGAPYGRKMLEILGEEGPPPQPVPAGRLSDEIERMKARIDEGREAETDEPAPGDASQGEGPAWPTQDDVDG